MGVLRRVPRAVYLVAAAIGVAAALIWSLREPKPVKFWLVGLKERPEAQLHIALPLPRGSGPLAHYTEHLAWLPNIGKDSRPEDRDSNAWTSDYAVGYWLSGPPEDLTDMLRRLKVVFDPIDLPRDVAETERDIVLREYDWRMADNPPKFDSKSGNKVSYCLVC